MLVGGMPEVVGRWVESHDYLACQEVQDDIIVSYEDDFPKYREESVAGTPASYVRESAASTSHQEIRLFTGG